MKSDEMNPQEQAARKLAEEKLLEERDAEFAVGTNCTHREWWQEKAIALESQLSQARSELQELDALRAGARTGMLKFMIAGDVGCFADRMKQLLQAENWDGMRLCVTDFFNAAADVTQAGRQEIEREYQRAEKAELALSQAQLQLSEIAKAAGYDDSILAAPCNALAHNIKTIASSSKRFFDELSQAQAELARLKKETR